MKSILLIGLGRFGKHIAMHLNHLGHQVMAVDTSEERVEDVLPIVTNAQIGDSTNADFLESLGVRNYDVCIVAIGNNFQSSLETTSLLSELGARYITLCCTGGLIISVSEGLPMITCLFETASAVGTVGLSLGITPELNLLSRVVLILLMFFGRVGGLTLIFAALSGVQKKVSKLPKEKITVG